MSNETIEEPVGSWDWEGLFRAVCSVLTWIAPAAVVLVGFQMAFRPSLIGVVQCAVVLVLSFVSGKEAAKRMNHDTLMLISLMLGFLLCLYNLKQWAIDREITAQGYATLIEQTRAFPETRPALRAAMADGRVTTREVEEITASIAVARKEQLLEELRTQARAAGETTVHDVERPQQ